MCRRRRRHIDSLPCFSFQNRTHFVGLRFCSYEYSQRAFLPFGCIIQGQSYFSVTFTLRFRKVEDRDLQIDPQAVLSILSADMPVVSVHDLFHNGKPQAGAALRLILRAIEALK